MENKRLEDALSASWDIARRFKESGGDDVCISASELTRIIEGQQELCRMLISLSDAISPASTAHASEEARLLAVPAGEPLFYLNAYFTDREQRPVCIGRQYYVGSRYLFEI